MCDGCQAYVVSSQNTFPVNHLYFSCINNGDLASQKSSKAERETAAYWEHDENRLQNLVRSGLSWEQEVSLTPEIILALTGCTDKSCLPFKEAVAF